MYNNTTLNVTNEIGHHNSLAPVHTFEVCMSSLALVINHLLTAFIVCSKDLRRIKSHQIFINIEVIHIIHGLVFIPARFSFPSFLYYTYCILTQGLIVELLVSMIFLTFERFLAVKYPLGHSYLNGKKFYAALTFSWLLPGIFVMLAFHYRMTRREFIIFGTVMLPVSGLILGVANIKIYYLIKQHEKFIRNNAHKSRSNAVSKRRSLMKPSMICFGLVITYIVLWTPFFIRQLFLLFDFHTSNKHMLLYVDAAAVIGHANSLVDPFLFIYLSSPVKRKVKGWFTKRKDYIGGGSISTVVITGV